MIHKHGLEALNRTLQDIRENCDIMGGLCVILAGDFRQTLPIIPRGTMYDQINACIKSSRLWKYVKIMKLKTNMRLQRSNNNDAHNFSKYLLSIGDGKEKLDIKTGKMKFRENFGTFCPNIESLIKHVYPNMNQHIADHD